MSTQRKTIVVAVEIIVAGDVDPEEAGEALFDYLCADEVNGLDWAESFDTFEVTVRPS